MAKYQSKYKKRRLWWAKTTRNHTQRLKAAGHWHGLPRLTWTEWLERLDEFSNSCGYCWNKFEPDELWLEHIVGVNEGGPHRKENVIPTCPKCNQQKGSKSLWDFKQTTSEEIFAKAREIKLALESAIKKE